MRKFVWLATFLAVLVFSFSLIFISPVSVSAIGEVTPTPEPDNEETPDNIDVDELLQEGIEDIQNGEYRSALAKMDIVIEFAPEVMTAYLIRGIANSQLGFLDDAIDDFTSAIELEPWLSDLYLFRGNVYELNGDLTDALLDYDRAIYISPLTPDGYLSRSNVNYALNDSDAGDVDDLIARALFSFGGGDTNQVFAYLDEAIETGEGLTSIGVAYYIRAITNMNIGDVDAALDDYEAALEANPDFHNAYLARGILYREQGDIEAAGEDFYNRISIHGQETIEEEMDIGDTIEVDMAYRRVIAISFEGEEGQVVNISANDFGGVIVDPLIALLDPDGNPIAGDDDFGGALNSLIDDFELPEDGTYTILLSHAEGGYVFGFNGIVVVEIEED